MYLHVNYRSNILRYDDIKLTHTQYFLINTKKDQSQLLSNNGTATDWWYYLVMRTYGYENAVCSLN